LTNSAIIKRKRKVQVNQIEDEIEDTTTDITIIQMTFMEYFENISQ
jgi:hypothetical protein